MIARRLAVILAVGTFSLVAAAEDKPTPRACPAGKLWDDAAGGCLCGPGTSWDDAVHRCVPGCPSGKVQVEGAKPGTCIHAVQPRCPAGQNWSEPHGKCVPACPKSKVVDAKGVGCTDPGPEDRAPAPPPPVEKKVPGCPAGKQRTPAFDGCVPICPAGKVLDATGKVCVVATRTTCPEGREWKDAFEACVPICPAGQVLDFYGVACHPIKSDRRR